MAITPNRKGLKDLSEFNIDAQFTQQYGSQVFNYSGDTASAQYQQLCSDFSDLLQDILEDTNTLLSDIPVFQK